MAFKQEKEKKSNIEHFIGGRVCVLESSSAIHFENILLVESWWLWWRGLLTSTRPRPLQAIFNWTLVPHLPRSASFWSRRTSWQQRACLKAGGGGQACEGTSASLRPITLQGERKPLALSIHYMQNYAPRSSRCSTDRPFDATPTSSVRATAATVSEQALRQNEVSWLRMEGEIAVTADTIINQEA